MATEAETSGRLQAAALHGAASRAGLIQQSVVHAGELHLADPHAGQTPPRDSALLLINHSIDLKEIDAHC